MTETVPRPRKTARTIRDHKVAAGHAPLATVTAYDFSFAKLLAPEVDLILVGDSVGMVIQGERTTLPVTLDQMVYHTRCVVRGAADQTHVVADLPFMSYQASISQAALSAGRLMAEGGAEAVKLEGGEVLAPTIHHLVQVGIPVLAHIGMTPQSVHAFGGFKVQGKDVESRDRIRRDARAVQTAGAYAVVLEAIPADLAAEITSELSIPTIGIGAGNQCDGQILVMHDLLGLNPDFRPKFAKAYADLASVTRDAVRAYVREVESREFPLSEHTYVSK